MDSIIGMPWQIHRPDKLFSYQIFLDESLSAIFLGEPRCGIVCFSMALFETCVYYDHESGSIPNVYRPLMIMFFIFNKLVYMLSTRYNNKHLKFPLIDQMPGFKLGDVFFRAHGIAK